MTEVETQAVVSLPGAAAGLWTHTPVDWRGNETGAAKPSNWPTDAVLGAPGLGTRPGTALPGGLTGLTATPGSGTLTVAWTTTTLSDSSVDVGTTTNYGTHFYDPTMTLTHSVVCTGLAHGVLVHYRAASSAPGYYSVTIDNTATPT